MSTHLRLPLLVAPLLFAAVMLAGCSTQNAGVDPGSANGGTDVSAEAGTEDGGTDPVMSSYSAGPECDAYVAAKNASLAEANQQVVQVSPEDLPFAVDPYAVLCVDAAYTLDQPEDRPLGFEVLTDAVDGIGYNTFALSPDLTYMECASSDPLGCFSTSDGTVVVVGTSDAALEFFPDVNAVVLAGVHTSAEYRNG